MKEINISEIKFQSWSNIENQINHENIGTKGGKIYFYYNAPTKTLYYEKFNLFERALHKLFGYKSEFNRQNLWQFFKDRNWVLKDAVCPPGGVFRQIIGDKLSDISNKKEQFFREISHKIFDENKYIKFFEDGDLQSQMLDPQTKLSVLQVALKHQRYKLADWLIKNGADIQKRDQKQSTLLHDAASLLNHELREQIIRNLAGKLEINVENADQNTPLFFAIQANSMENIDLLLDLGAKPTVQDLQLAMKKNNFPLLNRLLQENKVKLSDLQFLIKETDENLIKFFKEKGADFNALDKSGNTLVLYAVRDQNMGLLKWLVEKEKVDVNLRGPTGQYPMEEAVKKQNFKILKFLIDHQAKTDIKLDKGKTLLHVHLGAKGSYLDWDEDAIRRHGHSINTWKWDERGLQLIINTGVDVNAEDDDGYTPLDIMDQRGDHSAIRIMAEHRARHGEKYTEQRQQKHDNYGHGLERYH